MAFGNGRASGLIKEDLAEKIREEILGGRLRPGEAIVESAWAKRFEVGQSSIREALNILAAEGFVEKDSGRSARVSKLSAEDIRQIYQVRATLEGLAARLVAERQPDLAELDQAIADMRSAGECRNMRALVERDLTFHLLLCDKSGNRFLADYARRLMYPLFAFTLVRILARKSGPEPFFESLEDHRRLLDAIRTGDPDKAERAVTQAMDRFAEIGRHVWIEGDD